MCALGDPADGATAPWCLSDDLGFALTVLARAYQAAVARVFVDVPQGPRGFRTLAAVVHDDQPNQLTLAAFLGIDRTVMTYVIDDLVAAGLVARELNPVDRRQRKIVATQRGTRKLKELEQRVREAEDEVLRSLAEDERAQVRTLLGRLAADVRNPTLVAEACDSADAAEPL